MKTNLENITSLLCECEEVNKQIKELKFGCLLKGNLEGGGKFECIFQDINKNKMIEELRCQKEGIKNSNIINLEIQNPIEYHHLMMYCENNGIKLSITNYNTTQSGIFFNGNGCCVLDSSKPLSQQSEETLGQIYNFLKG